MDIVPLAPEDITLEQAATIARRSTKTIRRAVQDGQLPRRYVLGARGPQLMFRPDDIQHWLQARHAVRETGTNSRPVQRVTGAREWHTLIAKISELQAALAANRASIAELVARLHLQDDAMSETQATIMHLAGKLTSLEPSKPIAISADEQISALEIGIWEPSLPNTGADSQDAG